MTQTARDIMAELEHLKARPRPTQQPRTQRPIPSPVMEQPRYYPPPVEETYDPPPPQTRPQRIDNQTIDRACDRLIASIQEAHANFTAQAQALIMVLQELRGVTPTPTPVRRAAPVQQAPAPVSPAHEEEEFRTDPSIKIPDDHFLLEAIASSQPLTESRARPHSPATRQDELVMNEVFGQKE